MSTRAQKNVPKAPRAQLRVNPGDRGGQGRGLERREGAPPTLGHRAQRGASLPHPWPERLGDVVEVGGHV